MSLPDTKTLGSGIKARIAKIGQGLHEVDKLISETLSQVEIIEKRLREEYLPIDKVKGRYIRKAEIENILNAKALLEECKNERKEIDRVVEELEGKSNATRKKATAKQNSE